MNSSTSSSDQREHGHLAAEDPRFAPHGPGTSLNTPPEAIVFGRTVTKEPISVEPSPEEQNSHLEQRREARRFLRAFLLVLLLGLGIPALINFIVDPKQVFETVRLEGFNEYKPHLYSGGRRRMKALQLLRNDYQVVILGSSRADSLVDPMNPAFGDRSVYNAALVGTTMPETKAVFDYVLEHQPEVEEILLGLDFVTFNGIVETNPDFTGSGFAGVSSHTQRIQALLSWQALRDSVECVAYNALDRVPASTYTAQGFHKAIGEVEKPPREAFEAILTGDYFVSPTSYPTFQYDRERLDLLEEMIRESRNRGIHLRLYISPIHAWQMEAIHLMGLWDTFEAWKRDLADIVARAGGGEVVLWDFANYNPVSMEAVPAPGTGEPMEWWRECSHGSVELGNWMTRVMQEQEAPAEPPSEESLYAVSLTPEQMDGYLAEQQAAQKGWQEAHPADLEALKDMVARTAWLRRAIQMEALTAL